MEIMTQLNQGTYDITMKGTFTFNDHSEFRGILETIGQPDIKHVVLYMGGVEFVDSAALGMLLLARDEAEKNQKGIAISGAVGQVKKIFDMARFHTLFTMN